MSKARIRDQVGEELVTPITFSDKAGGTLKFHLSSGGVYTASNKSFRSALDKVASLIAPLSLGADDLHAAPRKRRSGRQPISKCKIR